MNINLTNSSTDLIYDKDKEMYLDYELELLNITTNDIEKKIGDFNFYNNFSDFGVIEGSETIESIALNLPPWSILVYHKTSANSNNSIYPHVSGLLIVIKGGASSRVSFEYTRGDGSWKGFYDNLDNKKWTGWSFIRREFTFSTFYLSSSKNLLDLIKELPFNSTFIDAVVSSTPYPNLLAQLPSSSGILKINKIANTRCEIEFIQSNNDTNNNDVNKKYYCNYNQAQDKLSKWFGISFKGTKPIFYNGTSWVDANGSNV